MLTIDGLNKDINSLRMQNTALNTTHSETISELQQHIDELERKNTELTKTLASKVNLDSLDTAVCTAKSTCMADNTWQIHISGGDGSRYGTLVVHNKETGMSG